MEDDVRSAYECAGAAHFGESPYDLYGEIPVEGTVGMFYVDMDQTVRGRYVGAVDEKELLPYAFAKHDNYRLLGI
jgi:hypothetical protein